MNILQSKGIWASFQCLGTPSVKYFRKMVQEKLSLLPSALNTMFYLGRVPAEPRLRLPLELDESEKKCRFSDQITYRKAFGTLHYLAARTSPHNSLQENKLEWYVQFACANLEMFLDRQILNTVWCEKTFQKLFKNSKKFVQAEPYNIKRVTQEMSKEITIPCLLAHAIICHSRGLLSLATFCEAIQKLKKIL